MPPAVDLPTAPSANPAEAARLVKAFLLSSRSEEPSVAEFTEDSGPLHLSLEPLQKLIAVFSVTECYMCQILSSPRRIVRSIGRADFNYTTFGAVVCKWVSFDLSRWRNRGGCAPAADRQIPASGDLCITTVCQDTRTEAEARKINGPPWAKRPQPPTRHSRTLVTPFPPTPPRHSHANHYVIPAACHVISRCPCRHSRVGGNLDARYCGVSRCARDPTTSPARCGRGGAWSRQRRAGRRRGRA